MCVNKFISCKADPRVSRLVEATCFKIFLKIEETYHKKNLPLLIALLSFFDLNNKTFCFQTENGIFIVDFGLQDVLYITGIPIDGEHINWQPYSKAELPEEYTSQSHMVFGHVPCICFNTVANNCHGTFFKQLGLEKLDIFLGDKVLGSVSKKREKPCKISRHKDKNWREHNKYYTRWTNQDQYLVYQPYNEESE
ncbi:unnamed protein product, partial [Thlaspi arvense]